VSAPVAARGWPPPRSRVAAGSPPPLCQHRRLTHLFCQPVGSAPPCNLPPLASRYLFCGPSTSRAQLQQPSHLGHPRPHWWRWRSTRSAGHLVEVVNSSKFCNILLFEIYYYSYFAYSYSYFAYLRVLVHFHMSIAYLIVLVGFYYFSLVFDMCLGVMDNHRNRKEKGTKRMQNGRVTTTRLRHMRCGKSDIF
jgi:hypothetical protein